MMMMIPFLRDVNRILVCGGLLSCGVYVTHLVSGDQQHVL